MTFQYQERTPALWLRRIGQRTNSNFISLPSPSPVPPVAKVEAEMNQPETEQECDSLPEAKGARAKCAACGHRKNEHCNEDPLMHWPASEGSFGFFFCITAHCEVVDCDCWAFRATANEVPKMKRPSANDFTLCGNCGHLKGHHCKARKATKKATADWQGFEVKGVPYRCQHTLPHGQTYRCESASCAEVVMKDGGATFCDCPRYKNPLLKPKKRATKAVAPRKRKGKAPFVTGQSALVMDTESGVNP
jgi:hypothetical protein